MTREDLPNDFPLKAVMTARQFGSIAGFSGGGWRDVYLSVRPGQDRAKLDVVTAFNPSDFETSNGRDTRDRLLMIVCNKRLRDVLVARGVNVAELDFVWVDFPKRGKKKT